MTLSILNLCPVEPDKNSDRIQVASLLVLHARHHLHLKNPFLSKKVVFLWTGMFLTNLCLRFGAFLYTNVGVFGGGIPYQIGPVVFHSLFTVLY